MNQIHLNMSKIPNSKRYTVQLEDRQHNYAVLTTGSLIYLIISSVYLLETIFTTGPDDAAFAPYYIALFGFSITFSLLYLITEKIIHNKVAYSLENLLHHLFALLLITTTTLLTAVDQFFSNGYLALIIGLIGVSVLISTNPFMYIVFSGFSLILYSFLYLTLHASMGLEGYMPALLLQCLFRQLSEYCLDQGGLTQLYLPHHFRKKMRS